MRGDVAAELLRWSLSLCEEAALELAVQTDPSLTAGLARPRLIGPVSITCNHVKDFEVQAPGMGCRPAVVDPG